MEGHSGEEAGIIPDDFSLVVNVEVKVGLPSTRIPCSSLEVPGRAPFAPN
jgi:hypothetical protein